jgi:ketosteroid isomerase-like protein
MARILLVATLCLAVFPNLALAVPSPDVDALMRHYDAAAVAAGKIHVSADGDLVYVRGLAPGTPWIDVWRHDAGDWKLVAEMVVTELAPIRFGAKRNRSCRTS